MDLLTLRKIHQNNTKHSYHYEENLQPLAGYWQTFLSTTGQEVKN